MEDINAKVLLEGYGLRLYGAVRGRGSFIVKTDKGIKELRRYSGDERRIIFENSVRLHLRAHGFSETAPFCTSREGSVYYCIDGGYFVLEEYEEGQGADLEDEALLLRVTALLAKFHLASCGMENPLLGANAGRLLEIYEKRMQELGRIRKWIARRGTLSNMDLLVMKNAAAYQKKIDRARKLLIAADYERLFLDARQAGALCHHTYKGDNIRLLANGRLYLTGFSQCGLDLAVVDLSEFIRRHVKTEQSNAVSVGKILFAYQQIRPLSKEERKLLCAMLVYPYKFVKLCNEYYNKRRVYVSDAIVQKMERCLLAQAKLERIVEEIFLIQDMS